MIALKRTTHICARCRSGLPRRVIPNQQQVLTDGEDGQDVDVGIEVTYEEEKETELVWI